MKIDKLACIRNNIENLEIGCKVCQLACNGKTII